MNMYMNSRTGKSEVNSTTYTSYPQPISPQYFSSYRIEGGACTSTHGTDLC